MGRTYDHEYAEFATGAMRDLRRMAYLMCHDWHRAEDVAQDTLLKMYDAWPRIRDHEGLMPYARRVLVRAFIDNRRRPWHREALVEPPNPPAVSADMDGVADRMLVLAALSELPPRRRACVVLRYYLQLSVAETAIVMACAEGTVKSQTKRGLEDLRDALERRGFTNVDFSGGVVA
ncbi:SigE family RNA polymerase sigma factor [Nocardioides speluncae]|uniref:SigE family RNA polymerase sigma factor n=1 Tax=Nocardioides speluncae TaxID=2670337 RepID=UPI000D6912AA|nr:SigE family RNA polymerase sigma factor [Nocardioides speluncae]